MAIRPRGGLPNWRPSRARQKGILADVLACYRQHHADDTLPRGGRGIFYDLRPNGLGNGVSYRKPDSQHPVKSFGPMEAHPAAVQEVLALARRAGMVPESWVADGRAPEAPVPYYDESADEVAASIADQVERAAESFQLDPQRGQPQFVEVLCEAADLAPRIARVAGQHGVPVYSGAGFDGLKGKRAFAGRAMDRDVPTVVLHVGDRDDDGDNIYIAAAEDAVAWAGAGYVVPLDHPDVPRMLTRLSAACVNAEENGGGKPGLIFARLALTTAQARAHDLLDADGKAEVDAVPVPVMDGWLTEAVEALQDPARREALDSAQEQERERLPGAIRSALDGAA